MKTMKKPTQKALAAALGIDPAIVTRDKQRGMPLHSIEAAQSWRDANLRVRVNPDASAGTLERALRGEQAAEQAAGLMQAAGDLLEAGGDISPMVASIRQAMARVPPAQRARVLFPFTVMDVLTNDVASVLEAGDPHELIYGRLHLDKRDKGESVNMGSFWYAVAAGEIYLAARR